MNDFLENYSKTRTIEIKGDPNSIIISSKAKLYKYTIEALNNNISSKHLHLGIVPKRTIIRIEEGIKNKRVGLILNMNIQYDVLIDQETIRHIKKKSLSKDDAIKYVNIVGDVITNYDMVEYSVYKFKQHVLRFKKNTNDGHYIVITIISNSKRRFRVHTIFLLKKDYLIKKRS